MNDPVQNALKFINQRPDIRQFMIDFNEESFMFSKSPYIGEICLAVESDCHSGASFGCMLQECRVKILDDISNGKKFTTFCQQIGNEIGNVDNMDEANKNAIKVAESQGMESFIAHMFTEKDTGRKLSYSEMRYLYG
jgi:hypothetical protein